MIAGKKYNGPLADLWCAFYCIVTSQTWTILHYINIKYSCSFITTTTCGTGTDTGTTSLHVYFHKHFEIFHEYHFCKKLL